MSRFSISDVSAAIVDSDGIKLGSLDGSMRTPIEAGKAVEPCIARISAASIRDTVLYQPKIFDRQIKDHLPSWSAVIAKNASLSMTGFKTCIVESCIAGDILEDGNRTGRTREIAMETLI